MYVQYNTHGKFYPFFCKIKPHGKSRAVLFMELVVTLVLVLAGSLGLLAALDAGALVILLAAQVVHDAVLGAAAFEPFERIVERLVLLNMDFRHLFFPPSEYASKYA